MSNSRVKRKTMHVFLMSNVSFIKFNLTFRCIKSNLNFLQFLGVFRTDQFKSGNKSSNFKIQGARWSNFFFILCLPFWIHHEFDTFEIFYMSFGFCDAKKPTEI